ncbi:hypothetical protein SG34_029565 [Thalassomonas viridans]|uniref:Uncharacterized protein n=1 Tax=Thalassomonas viridans TaxID=137584 RepID=A0AAF0CAT1_9GAMM|nr:hypothetical protein [Thalassomonas viridans]WDE08890.1 hypothetical protein SG34_033930 [Thalassomonas viridans]WDE08937.1 hypothetical protein SG34_029565 [Thalassomonas viridans]
MAKPNDMPEFHSVKVYLTENIPIPLPESIAKLIPKHQQPPTANAVKITGSTSPAAVRLLTGLLYSTNTGGRYHV